MASGPRMSAVVLARWKNVIQCDRVGQRMNLPPRKGGVERWGFGR